MTCGEEERLASSEDPKYPERSRLSPSACVGKISVTAGKTSHVHIGFAALERMQALVHHDP